MKSQLIKCLVLGLLIGAAFSAQAASLSAAGMNDVQAKPIAKLKVTLTEHGKVIKESEFSVSQGDQSKSSDKETTQYLVGSSEPSKVPDGTKEADSFDTVSTGVEMVIKSDTSDLDVFHVVFRESKLISMTDVQNSRGDVVAQKPHVKALGWEGSFALHVGEQFEALMSSTSPDISLGDADAGKAVNQDQTLTIKRLQ